MHIGFVIRQTGSNPDSTTSNPLTSGELLLTSLNLRFLICKMTSDQKPHRPRVTIIRENGSACILLPVSVMHTKPPQNSVA